MDEHLVLASHFLLMSLHHLPSSIPALEPNNWASWIVSFTGIETVTCSQMNSRRKEATEKTMQKAWIKEGQCAAEKLGKMG